MILNYDLPKLESELLSFQLDSKQKEVLESALNYIKSDIKINSDTKHLCISGSCLLYTSPSPRDTR